MKHFLYVCISLIFLLASTSNTSFAQTLWTKYHDNPVLNPGSAGSWDAIGTGMNSVLFDGVIYQMWYTGYDGLNLRIGHATSTDGLTWEKDANNPVLDLGSAGSWDDFNLGLPCVFHDGAIYHIWYNGGDGSYERIGHATSVDGSTWTKDTNNPVLDVGITGSWDETEVFPGARSVIFDGNIFHMWYGGTSSSYIYAIGHATSQDGSIWVKDTTNPVMTSGKPGSWDQSGIIPGTIIFDGSTFQIWYSGHSGDFRWRVGYATSSDGVNWSKNENLVLDYGSSGSWDFLNAWNGSVLFDNQENLYKMWYTGGDFYAQRTGYATAIVVDAISDFDNTLIPEEFKLSQNYPNPFNPSTTIEFSIPKTEFVTLKIYNVLGQEVLTLVSEKLAAGSYKYNWNAGHFVSGIYFCKLEARGPSTGSGQGIIQTRKLILMR